MTLYQLTGRIVAPFRVAGFNLFNHFFHVPRARVVVRNKHGDLLLVKSWGAQAYWSLPGGGVKRNETPQQAARRELFEEINLQLSLNRFAYLMKVQYSYEAQIYTVTLTDEEVSRLSPSAREILDCQWFSLENLPADLSPLVMLVLEKLSKDE